MSSHSDESEEAFRKALALFDDVDVNAARYFFFAGAAHGVEAMNKVEKEVLGAPINENTGN